MNFLQVDANRVELVATSVHLLWDGVLQVKYPFLFLELAFNSIVS